MQKPCTCGQTMHLQVRTVIFSNKVEIERVPIFTCENCHQSEIFAGVKPELKSLIRKWGKEAEKQRVYFPDVNELAHIIHLASVHDTVDKTIEEMIEERVNELLDMLILAKSLMDSDWEQDIHNKLKQISSFTISSSL